jgi:hypothetical protein
MTEDCPRCGQHFGNCTLMMESHRSRYPDHFKASVVESVEAEAVLVDLEPKIYRGKTK